MVNVSYRNAHQQETLSVLALSSRFDGRELQAAVDAITGLSVLALSSRFDGQCIRFSPFVGDRSFSTRSVESF